jgi:hypothetical protein
MLKYKLLGGLLTLGLSLSANAELLFNNGFEAAWTGGGNDFGVYVYTPIGTDVKWQFSGSAGLSKTGTAWGGTAPEGDQFAFLQGGNSNVFQTFTLTGDSDVLLDFSWASRNFNFNQRVRVSVDGVEKDFFHADSPLWTTRMVDLGQFSTGVHTLRFSGTSTGYGDVSAFIDAVNLTATPSLNTVSTPTSALLALLGLGLCGFRAKKQRV